MGVAIQFCLAEHAGVVDVDLEDPAAGRDQRQLLDVGTQLGEQLSRQTDGSVPVASEVAVLDTDAHGLPSQWRTDWGE